MELEGKTIDCVWNGMTLTDDDVLAAMECSQAYCNNAQVVIVPADVADQYQDAESLSGLVFAVESGSAGEEEAIALGNEYTAVLSQADALMEVNAGTSDAAIIDSLMAAAMVGEGTGYADLTYTVGLNSEEVELCDKIFCMDYSWYTTDDTASYYLLSALDPELTGEVLRVIKELADQNTTMIIVTHEMTFARDVASQVVFMDNGVIVEQGDPLQVFEHPAEERTRQFLSRYTQG